MNAILQGRDQTNADASILPYHFLTTLAAINVLLKMPVEAESLYRRLLATLPAGWRRFTVDVSDLLAAH
jgi:hypothetical protein